MVAPHAIFTAIEEGDLAGVERILATDRGALEARNPEGLSPITVAAYWGERQVLALLVEAASTLDIWEAAVVGDADRAHYLVAGDPRLVEARSSDGFTALHLAVFFGSPETAEVLLAAGADVSARTTNALDNQPLHAAVAGADPAARLASVKLLLDAGATPNERQSGGFTPIMSAAQNGDDMVVDLLLAHGADPMLSDDRGRTAADLAEEGGYPRLAVRLQGGTSSRPEEPDLS